jgi:hypothetical protein
LVDEIRELLRSIGKARKEQEITLSPFRRGLPQTKPNQCTVLFLESAQRLRLRFCPFLRVDRNRVEGNRVPYVFRPAAFLLFLATEALASRQVVPHPMKNKEMDAPSPMIHRAERRFARSAT